MRLRSILLLAAVLLAGTAARADDHPAVLRALAVTDTSEVHPNDVFSVTLSLQNLTGIPQKIRLPGAAWNRCWKSDNIHVTWDYIDAINTDPVTISIPPHKTYTFPNPLRMFVSESYSRPTVSFRMGFKTTPLFGKILWSTPIPLDVIP